MVVLTVSWMAKIIDTRHRCFDLFVSWAELPRQSWCTMRLKSHFRFIKISAKIERRQNLPQLQDREQVAKVSFASCERAASQTSRGNFDVTLIKFCWHNMNRFKQIHDTCREPLLACHVQSLNQQLSSLVFCGTHKSCCHAESKKLCAKVSERCSLHFITHQRRMIGIHR